MAKQHQSLMDKFLTLELREELGQRETSRGFRLNDVIKSGLENPDSGVGVYAPDPESYEVFSPLFNNIIEDYHGHGINDVHRRDFDPSNLSIDELDSEGDYIVSTRVRVGRNIEGFPLMPGISKDELSEVERLVVNVLTTFDGDLAGSYYPLMGMPKAVRLKLIEDHFLFEGGREPFKEGDRFLESAGVTRNWPIGRGIFHSDAKNFLVWINEEDQLRIISMEKGGNLFSVFERLTRAVFELEKKLKFAYSDRLGYLSSCPTNLGTAMRASFHLRLPELGKDEEKLKSTASDFGLSVRGINGEHTESEGGIYDISNKRRLGISEVDAVQTLYDGTKQLIELERVS